MLRGSGQEDEDDIENYDDFSDNNSTAPAENSTTTTDASVEGAYTTESAHPEDAFDVPPWIGQDKHGFIFVRGFMILCTACGPMFHGYLSTQFCCLDVVW